LIPYYTTNKYSCFDDIYTYHSGFVTFSEFRNPSALLPVTKNNGTSTLQHTALPVQATQTHRRKCRCSSTHSLALHHKQETGQLHRLATSLPGKESPVPIIRVSPRAILGIFEHIKISHHCGKPKP